MLSVLSSLNVLRITDMDSDGHAPASPSGVHKDRVTPITLKLAEHGKSPVSPKPSPMVDTSSRFEEPGWDAVELASLLAPFDAAAAARVLALSPLPDDRVFGAFGARSSDEYMRRTSSPEQPRRAVVVCVVGAHEFAAAYATLRRMHELERESTETHIPVHVFWLGGMVMTLRLATPPAKHCVQPLPT